MHRILCAGLALCATAHAADIQVTHSGRLLDNAGTPISGTEDLTVSLFDSNSDTPDVLLWADTFTGVPVSGGYFALQLGSGNVLSSSLFAENASVWVEVSTAETTLGRQRLSASAASATAYAVVLPEAGATCQSGALGVDAAGSVLACVEGSWTSLMPRGAIALWSGALADIPAGWALCDGSAHTAPNGDSVSTPDLRGRFVVGAGAGANPGGTGGSTTHSHVYTAVPLHNHGINNSSHRHWVSAAPTDDRNFTGTNTANGQQHGTVADAGSHNANYTSGAGMYSNYATTGITINNAGTSSPSTNASSSLPPYFEVAYIMKL